MPWMSFASTAAVLITTIGRLCPDFNHPRGRLGRKRVGCLFDAFLFVTILNPPITFKFTNIFYPWGQFDPSNLNLQKMIIIKKCTQVYVSGTLCLFVDYLNSPLNKTIPPPIPLIHPENILHDYGEICISPENLTD